MMNSMEKEKSVRKRFFMKAIFEDLLKKKN